MLPHHPLLRADLDRYRTPHLRPDARILDARPLTDNPADAYLEVVLAALPLEYATWIFNSQTGGYIEGRYFFRLSAAAVDFEERR